MSDTSPEHDDALTGETTGTGGGRTAALVGWVLYVLTLPTGGLAAMIGVIIAYVARREAEGVVRTHFDAQIRLFWSGFIWAALLTVAWGISLFLTTIFIGIPLLFVVGAALLLLGLWFTIRSVQGALALADNRLP